MWPRPPNGCVPTARRPTIRAEKPAGKCSRPLSQQAWSYPRRRQPSSKIPGQHGMSEKQSNGARQLEVMAAGPTEHLVRPCVDCGMCTGSYCDHCQAKHNVPDEWWATGQHTPLCSKGDARWRRCHFCRQTPSCRPFAYGAEGVLVRSDGRLEAYCTVATTMSV